MTIVAPGEFEYRLSYDGDGRVPHDLGLLKDVTTYFWTKCMAILRATKRCSAPWTSCWRPAPRMNCQRLVSAVRAVPTMRDYRPGADLVPDGGARADRRQGEEEGGRRH
jgi:hypothetical protein